MHEKESVISFVADSRHTMSVACVYLCGRFLSSTVHDGNIFKTTKESRKGVWIYMCENWTTGEEACKRKHFGICNSLVNTALDFLSYHWGTVFQMVMQEPVIENNQTTGEDTHTWVLKSWVGSLGASSMSLSMLDTYLEGTDRSIWKKCI